MLANLVEDSFKESYPNLVKYGVPFVEVAILVFLAFKLSGWIRTICEKVLTESGIDATLAKFCGNLARGLILTIAIVTGLSTLGFHATSFVAIIGAAGLSVGLALQGTLSNFAAGVMLLLFRPFRVGCRITAAGQNGMVDQIDIFHTVLDTKDGRRVYVPNSSVFSGIIENHSFHKQLRIEASATFDCRYSAERVRRLLENVVHVDPAHNVQRSEIHLHSVTAENSTWVFHVWTNIHDENTVREHLMMRLKDVLDGLREDLPDQAILERLGWRLKTESFLE